VNAVPGRELKAGAGESAGAGRRTTGHDETIVAARSLSKRFGERTALQNVSFSLNPKEVLGYVGPNGAGKTTTLRILVGTEMNFEGELFVHGRPMPRRREEVYGRLGFMPQGVAFGGWRTAGETLRLLGRLSGLEPERLERRIDETLELVGLAGEARTRVSAFSGGMVQRLGLAQAILHEPGLLVLDEPFNHLDPSGRVHLKRLLSELNARGVAILFSSHILADVEEIVHRLVVLQRGRVRFMGTPAELSADAAGASEVEIGCSNPEEGLALAAAVPGVASVHAAGGGTLLLVIGSGAAPDSATTRVLSALIAAGQSIHHVRPMTPGLEEIVARLGEEAPS
jgi:ABC-2 type transport system ATP-binding protein